ncbi:hypothetical protein V8G54_020898 [Vigna mungo]|uniref:Uncharacterized protein n=1 Tax=Vigna mungo TaxID=3915 RepID=A0AAQ3NET7_VIGMU
MITNPSVKIKAAKTPPPEHKNRLHPPFFLSQKDFLFRKKRSKKKLTFFFLVTGSTAEATLLCSPLKLRVPLEFKLAGLKSCLSILPAVTEGPTCHTWLTLSTFSGTLTFAKILITPPTSSPLISHTSNDSFPGTMSLYDFKSSVFTVTAPRSPPLNATST